MFFKSRKLPFIILGTSLLICISVFAAPALKQIKAYLNPSIQYTLNGQAILTDTTTLSYQNKNYVSIAELANALGLDITFDNNTINLSTPHDDAVTISNAVIKEVIPESNKLIILPNGAEDTASNSIVLLIDYETLIQSSHTNQTYTLKELKKGMTLSVTHSSVMTRSLPPQTVAYTLTILENNNTSTLNDQRAGDTILSKMNIVSVNSDENYFIVVPEGKDETDFHDQIMIRYSNNTVMHTQPSQELTTSFKEGQVVTIKVGPAATLSIPPQMLALEITLES